MSNNNYEEQYEAWMRQHPKQAMQAVAGSVRDYVNLVNRIAEVIRLTDDVSNKPLDTDLTVADLMLTLVRRGEKLNTIVDMLHEYASRLDTD